MTYVDLLCQDNGQTPAEIKTCMENRLVWRAITDVRQMSTEWEWVSEDPHACSALIDYGLSSEDPHAIHLVLRKAMV